jgi:molybdopterin-containing oxidoreductase family iron-sulfur binding subunit
MVVDLNRCIGCRTCAVVCKTHNAEPEGIWWNRVFASGSPSYGTSVIVDGQPRMEFLPVSCQHCEDAPCETACPTKATYTDEETGTVLIDYERCIGCRFCMSACPYGVRQFNWSKPKYPEATDGGEYHYGYPQEYRSDGHLVYTPTRPEGVVEKCTFCAQYTSQGIEPACCSACPANARIFGDLDDPDSEISKYLKDHETFTLGQEYNTHPRVFYVPSKHGTEGA